MKNLNRLIISSILSLFMMSCANATDNSIPNISSYNISDTFKNIIMN